MVAPRDLDAHPYADKLGQRCTIYFEGSINELVDWAHQGGMPDYYELIDAQQVEGGGVIIRSTWERVQLSPDELQLTEEWERKHGKGKKTITAKKKGRRRSRKEGR